MWLDGDHGGGQSGLGGPAHQRGSLQISRTAVRSLEEPGGQQLEEATASPETRHVPRGSGDLQPASHQPAQGTRAEGTERRIWGNRVEDLREQKGGSEGRKRGI